MGRSRIGGSIAKWIVILDQNHLTIRTPLQSTILSNRSLNFFKLYSSPAMVVSEVALAIGVELVLRRTGVSLAALLFYRSLFALIVLALCVMPARAEWTPLVPRLAALRVITGGMFYIGWFGSIGTVSARVSAAILMLDSLLLALFRRERRAYERGTIAVLAASLMIFAGYAMREPGTVTNLSRGIVFLAIALVSRAASYKVWERSQQREEHLFWLIAPSLIGGTLGGLALGRLNVQALTPTTFAYVMVLAVVGVIGYFYMNEVMRAVGAFYCRVIELWQVPVLWLLHLPLDHARPDLVQGTSFLVAAASAFAYYRHMRDSGSAKVNSSRASS
jgi:drug/metabolite transporter (DMT)-like permease